MSSPRIALELRSDTWRMYNLNRYCKTAVLNVRLVSWVHHWTFAHSSNMLHLNLSALYQAHSFVPLFICMRIYVLITLSRGHKGLCLFGGYAKASIRQSGSSMIFHIRRFSSNEFHPLKPQAVRLTEYLFIITAHVTDMKASTACSHNDTVSNFRR